jgi:hypothetical protein
MATGLGKILRMSLAEPSIFMNDTVSSSYANVACPEQFLTL